MSKMDKDRIESLLDAALTRLTKAAQTDNAAVARVLKRLSGALPRQKMAVWRLPGVLLDWQFAPAWPRVAALACCAALGFAIGITGIDRPFDGASGPVTAGSVGIDSIVFEPEALTGARP